ncbi:MAG TPA: hypothetical protein VKA49_00215 [Flavitalea sp.]|nr:hypothetical protein [Flavitalea sp.]
MHRLSVIITLFFYFLSGSFFNLLAAQVICDPSLPGIKEGTLGYRDRGDRCEGLYINPVSSTTLFVASFTEYFENFDNTGNTILVEWDKPPANKEIHLRAQGIRPRLYYRMDAYSSGANTFFAWPSGVLSSLNIRRSDVGVIGRIKLPVGNTERFVHIPLRIRSQAEAKHTSTYKLVLMPGVQLTEVYITLSAVGQNGKPERFLKAEEALGYGYYPAERAVEISIGTPKEKGIYYLKLGAKIKSGGTKAIEFWFYNAGTMNSEQ